MNTQLQNQIRITQPVSFRHIRLLQRKCACGQHTIAGGECAGCRQKREEMMQRAAVNYAPTNAVPPIVHEVLSSSGQPLDAGTREFMEPRFGYDFSQVRVHTDARAAESARAVNALAYTIGQNIAFGAGQYAPKTDEGRSLIGHELTHVVQQKGTGATTLNEQKVTFASSQSDLEAEADRNAVNIARDQPISIRAINTAIQMMKQTAGPPPPQRTTAPASPSGVGSSPTRKQIERDNFLRQLAGRPDFALDSWRRLKPQEQIIVVAYMAELYGLDFAKRFREATLRLPRRENLIVITNYLEYTPQRLIASGYKLYSSGRIQTWIHPSGKEIWVIPPSIGTPQQAPPPEDPAVMEARGYAEDFTTERDHIVDLGTQLKNHIGKAEYPQLYKQFMDEFNKWQNDLNLIREQALPDLKEQVAPQDRQALETHIKRLDELFEWKSTGFPDLVRDLPLP